MLGADGLPAATATSAEKPPIPPTVSRPAARPSALRNSLRQDPDVIMVGEMRDRQTMQTVLTAAETGHLVFSTLHTNSAVQTIDRIIDSFPEGNHRQIRQQLSQVLQAVVSLKLVEKIATRVSKESVKALA